MECKWKADRFDPKGIQAFRRQYPDGQNFLVAQDIDRPFTKRYGALSVRYIGLHDLP